MQKRREIPIGKARAHLREVDPLMGELIDRVGKTSIRSEADSTVYQSLLRAIVYQMLSTQSARAIYQRLLKVCNNEITPASIAAVGEDGLRDIGFSRAKVASALDLNQRIQSGEIPPDEEILQLDNEQVIKQLVQVKGIGRWTVEMLLIFNLQRADVLASTDLGIRRGHMLAYGLDEMLPARHLAREGERWRPYRTVASWYLWRATDSVDWS